MNITYGKTPEETLKEVADKLQDIIDSIEGTKGSAMNGFSESKIKRMVDRLIEKESDLIEDVIEDSVDNDQTISETVRELSYLITESAIDEIRADFEDAGLSEPSDMDMDEALYLISLAIESNKAKFKALVMKEFAGIVTNKHVAASTIIALQEWV